MVPSLLPATSAPHGVSVVPSCLTSSADGAPWATPVSRIVAAIAVFEMVCSVLTSNPLLEASLVGQRQPGTVLDLRPVADADQPCGGVDLVGRQVVVVGNAEVVSLVVCERHAEAVGARLFVSAAEHGAVALQPQREARERGDVPARP